MLWTSISKPSRTPANGGPPARMSDSQVLCLGLATQWHSGVPWKTERGVLRYVRKHMRHLFPTLLSQSAFTIGLRTGFETIPLQPHSTRLMVPILLAFMV
jgi:hypothetical protein